MKRNMWLLAVPGALLIAGSAFAVSVGGTLYIKAKNTKLLASASPSADAVGDGPLQPGAEVIWKGADATDKRFHHVTAGALDGFVFQSNLSPSKPNTELLASGKDVDPAAFASSSAATKALGDGPIKYGEEEKDIGPEAVNQLMALDAMAKKVSTDDAANHAKQVGIFEVLQAKGKAAPTATPDSTPAQPTGKHKKHGGHR